MIKLELDTDAVGSNVDSEVELIGLGDMAVKETMTVLQLKELLLSSWSALALNAKKGAIPVPGAPATANHFRIRDGKVCREIID